MIGDVDLAAVSNFAVLDTPGVSPSAPLKITRGMASESPVTGEAELGGRPLLVGVVPDLAGARITEGGVEEQSGLITRSWFKRQLSGL